MHMRLLLAAGVLAMACTKPSDTGSTQMAVDTAAVKAGIDSLRAAYSRAEVAGDAAAIGQLWTETGTLDMYGAPRVKGRTAIEEGMKTDFAARDWTLSEITPIGTSVLSNDNGSEIGTYHAMYNASGAVSHEWGRYAVGLEKGTDGKWRVDYLMFFPDSTKAEKK